MEHERLVLWDIDGTLMTAGPSAWGCFERVITARTQRPFQRGDLRFDGKTDPYIARCLLIENGYNEEEAGALVKYILREIAAEARNARHLLREEGHVKAGVVELLAALRDTAIINTVLTGNVAANAVLKLTAFGLDDVIDAEVGGFGSDDEHRPSLVNVALKRVKKKYGATFPAEHVWIVGDTPNDFASARETGVRVALVATGSYSYDELAALQPDALFHNLSDTDHVLKELFADLI